MEVILKSNWNNRNTIQGSFTVYFISRFVGCAGFNYIFKGVSDVALK